MKFFVFFYCMAIAFLPKAMSGHVISNSGFDRDSNMDFQIARAILTSGDLDEKRTEQAIAYLLDSIENDESSSLIVEVFTDEAFIVKIEPMPILALNEDSTINKFFREIAAHPSDESAGLIFDLMKNETFNGSAQSPKVHWHRSKKAIETLDHIQVKDTVEYVDFLEAYIVEYENPSSPYAFAAKSIISNTESQYWIPVMNLLENITQDKQSLDIFLGSEFRENRNSTDHLVFLSNYASSEPSDLGLWNDIFVQFFSDPRIDIDAHNRRLIQQGFPETMLLAEDHFNPGYFELTFDSEAMSQLQELLKIIIQRADTEELIQLAEMRLEEIRVLQYSIQETSSRTSNPISDISSNGIDVENLEQTGIVTLTVNHGNRNRLIIGILVLLLFLFGLILVCKRR